MQALDYLKKLDRLVTTLLVAGSAAAVVGFGLALALSGAATLGAASLGAGLGWIGVRVLLAGLIGQIISLAAYAIVDDRPPTK